MVQRAGRAVARKNLFYEAVPGDLDSYSYIRTLHAFISCVCVCISRRYFCLAHKTLARALPYTYAAGT